MRVWIHYVAAVFLVLVWFFQELFYKSVKYEGFVIVTIHILGTFAFWYIIFYTLLIWLPWGHLYRGIVSTIIIFMIFFGLLLSGSSKGFLSFPNYTWLYFPIAGPILNATEAIRANKNAAVFPKEFKVEHIFTVKILNSIRDVFPMPSGELLGFLEYYIKHNNTRNVIVMSESDGTVKKVLDLGISDFNRSYTKLNYFFINNEYFAVSDKKYFLIIDTATFEISANINIKDANLGGYFLSDLEGKLYYYDDSSLQSKSELYYIGNLTELVGRHETVDLSKLDESSLKFIKIISKADIYRDRSDTEAEIKCVLPLSQNKIWLNINERVKKGKEYNSEDKAVLFGCKNNVYKIELTEKSSWFHSKECFVTYPYVVSHDGYEFLVYNLKTKKREKNIEQRIEDMRQDFGGHRRNLPMLRLMPDLKRLVGSWGDEIIMADINGEGIEYISYKKP